MEIAEHKYESDDDYDDHFKSEHYLRINKSISKAKFTKIDCLSPNVNKWIFSFFPIKI